MKDHEMHVRCFSCGSDVIQSSADEGTSCYLPQTEEMLRLLRDAKAATYHTDVELHGRINKLLDRMGVR